MRRRPPIRLAAAAAALAGSGVLPGLPIGAADAGPATWSPTLPATSAFDNLSAFPDGTAYATIGLVATTGGGVLPTGTPAIPPSSTGFFRSHDFGVTWSPVAPPAQGSRNGTSNLYVRFASPLVGYATYNGSAYIPPDPTGKISRLLCLKLTSTFRTTDGGSSWTPMCEPHTPDGTGLSNSPSPLAVGPDGRAVLITGSESTAPRIADGKCHPPAGVVYFSTNSGDSWVRGALPAHYQPAWTAKIHDNRTALVLAYHQKYDTNCASEGSENALFLTTDGGHTYRRVLACGKQPICTTAAFVSVRRLIVGRTDGSTLVSADAGRTWLRGTRLYEPGNDASLAANPDSRWWHWAQAFGFSDELHGYASTRGSGTWRTSDGGRSWVQERSHECVYYPFGVGENAAATPERSITGGPGTFSARVPGPAEPGMCHPTSPQLSAPADLVAVRAGGLAVGLDGTVQRSAPRRR